MNTVKVKICGLTRSEDVVAAAASGADALGFVFAASPRRLDAATAAELVMVVPDHVLRVGLFMNQPAADIAAILDRVPLDLLQFHGQEDNRFCAGFGLPFLKAISMLDEEAASALSAFPDAAGLLLDAHVPGGAGGTGRTFDWNRPVVAEQPLWLAGGLGPDNVADAVRHFQPYAVDVSSGVEAAPGVKDPERVRNFIHQAKQASHEPARTETL
jgi:phosphoribosylanthranilate isomerase